MPRPAKKQKVRRTLSTLEHLNGRDAQVVAIEHADDVAAQEIFDANENILWLGVSGSSFVIEFNRLQEFAPFARRYSTAKNIGRRQLRDLRESTTWEAVFTRDIEVVEPPYRDGYFNYFLQGRWRQVDAVEWTVGITLMNMAGNSKHRTHDFNKKLAAINLRAAFTRCLTTACNCGLVKCEAIMVLRGMHAASPDRADNTLGYCHPGQVLTILSECHNTAVKPDAIPVKREKPVHWLRATGDVRGMMHFTNVPNQASPDRIDNSNPFYDLDNVRLVCQSCNFSENDYVRVHVERPSVNNPAEYPLDIPKVIAYLTSVIAAEEAKERKQATAHPWGLLQAAGPGVVALKRAASPWFGMQIEYVARQASWGVESSLRFERKGKLILRLLCFKHISNALMTPKMDVSLVPCSSITSICKEPRYTSTSVELTKKLPNASDDFGEVWLNIPAHLEDAAVGTGAVVCSRSEDEVIIRGKANKGMNEALRRYFAQHHNAVTLALSSGILESIRSFLVVDEDDESD
ncbi:hypothetical protein JKP88DRAFT_280506 [Tribonema minus]|uniref:Uncharacterized protein n=1 Tax=Tribonema minus TaxID=303371 RepID=A0A836CCK0_9STRA|nr:hypothetical protein JKP88DRAFT_280506 [Tribonema minus]